MLGLPRGIRRGKNGTRISFYFEFLYFCNIFLQPFDREHSITTQDVYKVHMVSDSAKRGVSNHRPTSPILRSSCAKASADEYAMLLLSLPATLRDASFDAPQDERKGAFIPEPDQGSEGATAGDVWWLMTYTYLVKAINSVLKITPM